MLGAHRGVGVGIGIRRGTRMACIVAALLGVAAVLHSLGARAACIVPPTATAAILAGADADASATETAARLALVYVSHEMCIASQQCRRRFHLYAPPTPTPAPVSNSGPDWHLFAHLLDRLVDEMHVNATSVAGALCGTLHATNDSDAVQWPAVAPGASVEARGLWQLVLDNYSFCTENEVPDATAGCVCRRDKVCHETPGEEFAYSRGTFALIVCAFIGLLLYYGPRAAVEIAELRAALDEAEYRRHVGLQQSQSTGRGTPGGDVGDQRGVGASAPAVPPANGVPTQRRARRVDLERGHGQETSSPAQTLGIDVSSTVLEHATIDLGAGQIVARAGPRAVNTLL